MSEYQFYDFRAIDRPLDRRAMAELRAITSRADISPTRLVNEYHWGSFKGKPEELVEKHFDAFLYYANWGSRQVMFRLPAGTLDLAEVKPSCANKAVQARATPKHVIVDFDVGFDPSYDDFHEEGSPLDGLLPVRDELMSGDLRSLYLGWLAGLDSECSECDDDDFEPPPSAGLTELSEAQESLAAFLELDRDLLEAAVAGAPRSAPAGGPGSDELAAWIARLAVEEKDRMLLSLVEGESPHLGSELRARFRTEFAKGRPRAAASALPLRTVGELRAAREQARGERQRREAEVKRREQEREARKQAEARERHLTSLAGREERLWREVDTAIATKQPNKYDHAIALLKDLRDLSLRTGQTADVHRRIDGLREKHRAKPSFLRRLASAGLQGE